MVTEQVTKSAKKVQKYTNLDFEDLVLAERCGVTIVTARNRKSGETEVYLLVPDTHLRSVGSDVSYPERKSESRQNRREAPTE